MSAATTIGSGAGSGWLRRANRALAALERDRVCWAVLGIAMVGYAVLAMWLIRGTTLFVDGVNLFVNNRGLDAGALLGPLNGHLVLMERSVYAAGFALFGAGSVFFRLVEVAGALLAVGLLFEFLRRRIGGAAALGPAVLVLFLGTGWEVTIVPDVMTNTFCVAAGIAAFLALDRRDRRGDIAACLLLVGSICCWTLGAAFAVGAAVRMALEPAARRRLWVVAVPLAIYAAWFVWVRAYYVPAHGEDQNVAASNILHIPGYFASEAASVVAAVSGLGYDFTSTDPFKVFATDPDQGYPLALIAVLGVALVIRRRGARPALWGAIAALGVFWVTLALGLGLGRSPTTARYVYPGAVLSLLVVGAALQGARMSRRTLAVGLALIALALGANLVRLGQGARFFRDYSADQRAQWTAFEIAGKRADPSYPTHEFLTPISAGDYLQAVARDGSPAYTPAELAAQPEALRESADGALVGVLGLHLAPTALTRVGGSCHVIRAGSQGSAETVVVGAPQVVILRSRSRAPVALRRFASTKTVGVGSLRPGQLTALKLPADGYAGPWYVSVGPARAPVSACAAG